MSLPNSRNTTYAAGSQVKSFDLNDIQDKIVNLNTADAARRLTARVLPFGPASMVPDDPTMWEMDSTSGPLCWKRSATSGGVTAFLFVDLPLDVGDRLSDFTIYVHEANSLTVNRSFAHWERHNMAAFAGVDGGSPVISSGASAAPASNTLIVVAAVNQVLAQVYHRIGIVIECKTTGTLISGGHAFLEKP